MSGNVPILAVPSAAEALSRRRRGVLLMALGITLLATMDVIVKIASRDLSTIQIAWGRYLAQSIGLLAFMGMAGVTASLRSQMPGIHLFRAVLFLIANISFMAAIRYMPLAEANLIGFASPLLLTALSYPVLRERVGLGRWLAVASGFVGVLVVIGPSAQLFHWAALLPLLMAFCSAAYHVMTPIIRRSEDPAISVHYLGWLGAVLLTTIVPVFWAHPTPLGWAMLAAIGGLGAIGQILMIRAFEFAPTSVLAPLFYLHLIWALIYGLALFGDVPSPVTLFGAVLIIASGYYVYRAG